jgi:hydrogenase maturation protease
MNAQRILVAGIGNIFLGDDAFGVEVAQRLLRQPWPPEVRVVDFGIRGFDLAYALADGYDVAILVDALPRGEAPGTLYVLEPDLEMLNGTGGSQGVEIETHAMDPVKVLRLAHSMGNLPKQVLVVGCEPGELGSDEDMSMGLSEPVQAALDEAVKMVVSLVAKSRGLTDRQDKPD